jgi:hypothetical protein
LSPDDRKLAETQKFCPVLTQNKLGSMGTPVKLMIDGQPVFLCCAGCQDSAMENKAATLEKVKNLRESRKESSGKVVALSGVEAKIAASLDKLPDEDRALAEAQRFCPVIEKNRLGSMGVPAKVIIDGEPVFLCCASCREKAVKNPQETLAKARELAGRRHD